MTLCSTQHLVRTRCCSAPFSGRLAPWAPVEHWRRSAATPVACVSTVLMSIGPVWPHSTLCHSNKHYNQTLVLLVVQCGGSYVVFSSPLRGRNFSKLEFKSVTPSSSIFWPVAATSRWWSLEHFLFQIYIWNATISSFWKVLHLWAFQSSNLSIHLGKVPQRELFLSEFPPTHPSLHFNFEVLSSPLSREAFQQLFPLPHLERF